MAHTHTLVFFFELGGMSRCMGAVLAVSLTLTSTTRGLLVFTLTL
jgi:hypothetical protein